MPIAIHFPEIDVRYEHFVSYDISANFFFPPHKFSMTLFDRDPIKLRESTKPLSPCVIYYDSNFVLAGIILDQEINEDDSITIRGTDHTYKLDGMLDPANSIPRDTDLVTVVKRQVGAFGFDQLNTDNNEFRTFQNPKAQSVAPAVPASKWQVGKEKIRPEKAWGFLNKLTSKYGYFLEPGISGASLSLVKPEYNQAPVYRIQRLQGFSSANNVISRSISRGYRGVPSYVQGVARGGDSREKLTGNKVAAQLEAQINTHDELKDILGSRGIFDKFDHKAGDVIPGLLDGGTQRYYLPMFISDSFTADSFELENRVNREFIDFFKNTLVCRYTLPFHHQDGSVYATDTMIHVVDDVAGLDEDLYVAERSFGFSGETETTRLTLIRPQSYTI